MSVYQIYPREIKDKASPLAQASKKTNASLKKNIQSIERPCHLTRGHIAKLWIEMIGIYSQIFITKFGEVDSGTWYEVLRDLTPKALDTGLEKIRILSAGWQFIDYPPNALQFRAICLSFYDDLGLPHVN